MFNDGYFSSMGPIDWIGVALMAPFLLAMLALGVYLVLGMIGSIPRRRRLARRLPAEPARKPTPRQAPGD